MRPAHFIITLLLMAVSPVNAWSFTMLLSPQQSGKLSSDDRAKIERFFLDVSSYIPQKMRDRLGDSLEIRFENLGKNPNFSGLCGKNRSMKNTTLGATPYNQKYIEIHSGFLPYLLNESAALTSTNCNHQTVYDLAKATILHEVTHVFDFTSPLTSWEKAKLFQCDMQERSSQSFDCSYLRNKRGHISHNLQFLALSGWKVEEGIWGQINFAKERSPDPYERINPEEALAVNAEYYFLDPSFHCRKPALANFFREHLGEPNIETQQCSLSLPLSSNVQDAVPLDRVWEIHLLVAGPGQDAESRWGHSMFRIVVCAPERKEIGPACLNDISHHRVISPRADIPGISFSTWSGLTGAYDSRLFVYTMPEIIQEYTRQELRDLYSIPLKLSHSEKTLFLEAAAESFWSYKGKYYFITNNCAGESLQLLKMATTDANLHWSSVITPSNLRQVLKDLGYSNERPLENLELAVRNGYIFSSRKILLESAAKKIAELKLASTDGFSSYFDWVIKTSLKERKSLLQNADLDPGLIASFIVVEDILISYRSFELKEKLLKELQNKHEGILQNKLSAATKMKDNLTRIGYGIPQNEQEMKHEKAYSSLGNEEMRLAIIAIQDLTKKIFPNELNEIESMKEFRGGLTKLLSTSFNNF